MQNPLPEPYESQYVAKAISAGFTFRKVRQISESHCGPAVIQMLLSNIGISVTQRALAQAGGVAKTIASSGMRIDLMVEAIGNLQLNALLWYKNGATVADIKLLLEGYNYPVGVEWQGIFSEEQEITASTGHYSIVTHVDDEKEALIIVDPYKDFAKQDRIISIKTFLKRWWDKNSAKMIRSRRKRVLFDRNLLFVVTHSGVVFPPTLGLMRGETYNAPEEFIQFGHS